MTEWFLKKIATTTTSDVRSCTITAGISSRDGKHEHVYEPNNSNVANCIWYSISYGGMVPLTVIR
jgi:hypothetical protein